MCANVRVGPRGRAGGRRVRRGRRSACWVRYFFKCEDTDARNCSSYVDSSMKKRSRALVYRIQIQITVSLLVTGKAQTPNLRLYSKLPELLPVRGSVSDAVERLRARVSSVDVVVLVRSAVAVPLLLVFFFFFFFLGSRLWLRSPLRSPSWLPSPAGACILRYGRQAEGSS